VAVAAVWAALLTLGSSNPEHKITRLKIVPRISGCLLSIALQNPREEQVWRCNGHVRGRSFLIAIKAIVMCRSRLQYG
jgi:hypothetical protein